MNPLIVGKDLASLIVPAVASAVTSVTAGGSGDNTAITGATIDRMSLTPYGAASPLTNVVPTGAVFLVYYEAVLAAAATITLKAAKIEDSADGSNWATIFDQTGSAGAIPEAWPLAGVVDTGGAGGSTQRGVVAFGTGIKKARRYVRFDVTPDLSAANTDTAKIAIVAVLSGIDELPPGVV